MTTTIPDERDRIVASLGIRYHNAMPNWAKIVGLKIKAVPECEGGGFMIDREQAELIMASIKLAMNYVASDRISPQAEDGGVTDEMVERACVAYYDKTRHSDWRLLPNTPFGDGNRAAKDKFRSDMRAALQAALSAAKKQGEG